MADVFISYARTDRQRITALAEALEAAGFSVWWDRSIAGGVEFSKEIERELNATKAVIVAWSASGNESPWVRDEASLARDEGKLISISLDGKKPPMGFRQFHALDFSSSNETVCAEAFDNLADSIKRLAAEEQSGLDVMETAANKIDSAQLPERHAVAVALRRLSRQNIPWRKIASIALAFIAAGVFLWRQAATDPPPSAIVEAIEAPEQSVAVLPFKNLSSDPEQVYFSDGVAGEILNALAQVRDLHVTAQSSSFQFRGENRDTRDVARRLGVAAVVDGSVQKLGDRIRVTAQLVDARSNRLVWSQTFDGEKTALFDIQDKVAAEIVSVMQANFDLDASSAAPKKRIDVPLEAYDLYLQAQAQLRSLLAAGAPNPRWEVVPAAYDLLNQAIDIAPDFALAYASRAEATWLFDQMDWAGTASTLPDFEFPFPIEEGQDRADADIEKALALGPDLAAAHISFRFHSSNDSSESGRQEVSTHVDAALRINPNHAKARNLRSQILRNTGQFRAGFEEAQRAFRLDPLNQDVVGGMFDQYFHFGDFENLEPFLDQSKPWTNDSGLLTISAFVFAEYGKLENLVELERRGAEIPVVEETGWDYFNTWSGSVWGFGASYATLGIPEMARLRLRGLYEDIFMIRDERYDEAIDFLEAEWAIQSNPEKTRELRHPLWRYRVFDIDRSLAFAYLFTAEHEKIIELSQQVDVEPELPGFPFKAGFDGPWIQTSYAYALYKTNADNADAWMEEYLPALENLLAQGIAIPNYEYEYARALTILGRNEEAFAALERAIDKGWRRWYFEVDPIVAPLREMPEFQALQDRYDSDIARMRKIVVEGLREQGFEIVD